MANNENRLPSELVGEVWPAAEPGVDPVLYGYVKLSPLGEFEARSLQTFELTYHAGRYGLDDTGSIKIVHRYSTDWGQLQMHDPSDFNYVTARSSNGTPLQLEYHPYGHQRPWYRVLRVFVTGGYISEGDTIRITFGDRSGGSPGLKLQTFCESDFEFKVLADVCATGHYIPVVDIPSIAIVPGKAALWRAVLPSLRKPEESFHLGIKAEDIWGNPTHQASGELVLECNLDVIGLPERIDYPLGQRSMLLEKLHCETEGILRITVSDKEGQRLAETNPLLVRQGELSGYWGDMHGQSGESIGINTAREYFDFARNLAFLDATSHQANDFQINNRFWAQINELTAEYLDEGRFVTFPGYEWSGNTGVGGDRNVYFREEGRQIRRSSHALLVEREDIHTDSPTAKQLFEDLSEEDCMVYAHIGGRPADIAMAHDPRLETAMEIHSAWGTFEWLLTDGFPLGHRSGVVCNSDGHKGRPGASYPGAATFGAYGGLTCFLTSELTRDSFFDCLKRRHHYGTTGNRLHLDVRAKFNKLAKFFEYDPRYFDVQPELVTEVMMGDIAQISVDSVELFIEVIAQAPIERIDVLNGTNTVETLRDFDESQLGQRIRILWQGAEYRGRGRQTSWQGEARFHDVRITRMEKINAWNHERPIELHGDNHITWDTLTTGNFGGVDLWLDEGTDASVDIETNHVSGSSKLNQVGIDDWVLDAGGLDRKIRVFRLPEKNLCREMQCKLKIPIHQDGDNPIWVRITTEDGFLAWSSPIFFYR